MSANANDGALHFDYRNLLAKSIPTIGVLERPKGYWNHLELFGTALGQWNALRASGIELKALSGPHLGASGPTSCLNGRLPAEPLSLLMIPLRIAIIKIVLEVNK